MYLPAPNLCSFLRPGPTNLLCSMTSSSCFLDAYWQWRDHKISLTQYRSCAVAHLRGARHSRPWQDGCETIPFEPFAASIRKLALEQGTYTPLTSPEGCCWEQLFNDRLGNTSDSFVKAQHHSLKLARLDLSPIQPLAVLALRAQRAPLVEWCLQQGAVVDRHFAREAFAMP